MGKLRFLKERLGFPKEHLRFLKEKLLFSKDTPNFPKAKLRFHTEELEFPKEKLRFLKEQLGFLKENLNFLKGKHGFPKQKITFLMKSLDILKKKWLQSQRASIVTLKQRPPSDAALMFSQPSSLGCIDSDMLAPDPALSDSDSHQSQTCRTQPKRRFG